MMDRKTIFTIYLGFCFSHIQDTAGQPTPPTDLCSYISTNYERTIEATSKWTSSGTTKGVFHYSSPDRPGSTTEENSSTVSDTTDRGSATTNTGPTTGSETSSANSFTTIAGTSPTAGYTTNGETSSTGDYTTKAPTTPTDSYTTDGGTTPTVRYTTMGETSSAPSYTTLSRTTSPTSLATHGEAASTIRYTTDQKITTDSPSTENDASTTLDRTSTEGYTSAEMRGCPVSYDYTFNGSCYKLSFDAKPTHTEAKRDCASDGAHLLFVETEEEFLFIRNITLEIKGGQGYNLWVGANGDADYLYWDDGSPANTTSFFQRGVTLSQWQSRCYETSDEDMRVREDAYCTKYNAFMCEYEEDNQFVYHEDIDLYQDPDPIIPTWDWERNESHVISTMKLSFYDGVPVVEKPTELARGFYHVIYTRNDTATGKRLTCSFKIYTCPRNFNHYRDGSCYNVQRGYYFRRRSASEYCRKYHSYLLIIDTQTDISILEEQEAGLSFWIGMNANIVDGVTTQHYWEDGVTADLAWSGINITDVFTIAHTDCYLVKIEEGGSQVVENLRCYHSKRFICEFRVSSAINDVCSNDLLLKHGEEFNSSLLSVADGAVTHFDGIAADAVPAASLVPCGTHHVIYQSPFNSWCFFRIIWECDPWAVLGDSSYGFFSDAHRWHDSRYLCKYMHNGHLADIHGAEENEFIRQQLSSDAWVGLRQSNSEYKWYDVAGDVTYTNWAEGHPTGEYQYVLLNSTDGTWTDQPLIYHSRICERDNP